MSASSGTEVRHPSPLGGRGLFATKPHQPGDVLLAVERPLIAVLDKPRMEDTCAWCFGWTELPVLSGAGANQVAKVNWCTGCKRVKYCSKQCQSRAWKAIHKRECRELHAEPEQIPNTVHALIQIMMGLGTGDKKYNPIVEMEAHRDEFEKAGGKRWEAMQLMVHTASTFMQERQGIKVQAESGIMAMCVLMCNSSRLVTPTFDPLGLILDPQVAMINHSCTPNAVVVFDGPKITVRALDAIPTGDEVLISYIDSTAPYGVRQAELKDQYFFTCNCKKCQLGLEAPQDAFLDPGPEFEERIKVIDDMIPEIEKDPAWPRHVLGNSTHDKRLSALQYYAYSYLSSPDADVPQDPAHFRKIIQIVRNTGVWPLTRAPMPALYQQYAVACLSARRYNEALIAMLRLHSLIDPTIYPQPYHPVRVVHGWTLATLAKAIGSDQDSAFCQALQSCGVDLSMLFLALLFEIRGQVEKSHGSDSKFGQVVGGVLQTMMEPDGELDVQYAQKGVKRDQWPKLLEDQMKEMWPKFEAFAKDESIAAQMDEVLAT